MITITLGGVVTMTGVSSEVFTVIKKALTIPNPAYHKVSLMTGSRYAVQANFTYFTYKGGVTTVPFGFLDRMLEWLDKYKFEYEIVDNTVDKTAELWINKKPELRDYQVPLVEKMVSSKRGGLVVASVGTGKTILICEAIRRQRKTSLIIVPNTVIQSQFVTTAKNMFDFDLGVVNGKQLDIREHTVCTWQSLHKVVDIFKDQVSHVYCDEAHVSISSKRMALLGRLNMKKLYGLTGTPKKSKDDGRTKAIFFQFGEPICEYKMTMMKPKIDIVYSGVVIPYDDFHVMVEQLTENENRNTLLKGLILGNIMEGRKCLILTKRVAHAEMLYNSFADMNGSFLISSKDKNKNELLDSLSNGDTFFTCLFGTFSLLATGTNIPSLDMVLFAGEIKSEVLVEQGGGRILRLFEGKPNPLIIDIADTKSPVFDKHFYERKRTYERLGWLE